jgi:small-conductance mechanosensitive channel
MDFQTILEKLAGNESVGSLVLILAAVLARIAAGRFLLSTLDGDIDQRRRILSNVKNGLFVLVVIGLFFIWAPALRTFALSLTAFAVAIIIATKELILCFSGAILKMASGSMRVGSWIEVGGLRGEVIDQNLMSTTIQELGSGTEAYEFTGKTVVLPNSLFLAAPVKNERFFKRYVIHSFSVILDIGTDPQPVIETMTETIKREMKDVEEVTRRYHALVQTRAGIEITGLEPTHRLTMTNEGRVKVSMTCFVPTRSAHAIERRAMEAALTLLRNATKEGAPA